MSRATLIKRVNNDRLRNSKPGRDDIYPNFLPHDASSRRYKDFICSQRCHLTDECCLLDDEGDFNTERDSHITKTSFIWLDTGQSSQ